MPDAPAPSSEEKALADKLMEELKASGVDVEAMQKAEAAGAPVPVAAPPSPAPKPEPKPEPSPAPTPPPPPTTAPAVASGASVASPAVASGAGAAPPPPPKKEKKKLSLKLPFSKKTPASPAEALAKAGPAPVADSETTEITHQALATMIDDKLKMISGEDFITIRISKSAMLVLLGLVLLFIWLTPIVSHQLQQLDLSKLTCPAGLTATSPKIRVRLGFDSLDTAQNIESLLKTAGYTNIETIKDESIASNAAQIATKDGQTDLNQKLTEILSKQYQISTDSAVLTPDSDFDATILIGPEAPKTTQ